MAVPATTATNYLPLLLYALAVFGLVAGLLAVSYLLGERRSGRGRNEPFESGITPVGYGRFRISVYYYVIAMFFVIFDVEAVFIFAWAVAFRDLGWPGYAGLVVFVAILLAALFYEWRIGALDWGKGQRRPRYKPVS
ncbi:MAG: NADH-quinone oxidoreductase subunit A [Nitrococcus mobilis]|nr:NADH-quinone oxidoreductase subunit A [Nitrococcus mobilis]